jgi:uncharacterized protein YjiS (DUF1127 family)
MSTLKAKHFHFIDDLDISVMTLAVIERIESFAAKVKLVVMTWIRRSNERRALAMMNQHMLDDIGLTPHDINREVAKYFWQK